MLFCPTWDEVFLVTISNKSVLGGFFSVSSLLFLPRGGTILAKLAGKTAWTFETRLQAWTERRRKHPFVSMETQKVASATCSESRSGVSVWRRLMFLSQFWTLVFCQEVLQVALFPKSGQQTIVNAENPSWIIYRRCLPRHQILPHVQLVALLLFLAKKKLASKC